MAKQHSDLSGEWLTVGFSLTPAETRIIGEAATALNQSVDATIQHMFRIGMTTVMRQISERDSSRPTLVVKAPEIINPNCRHTQTELFEDGAMYRCTNCGATGIVGNNREPIYSPSSDPRLKDRYSFPSNDKD